MSRTIAQQAAKCLANQEAYAALNAFVPPLKKIDSIGALGHRIDAAARRHEQHARKSSIDGQFIAIKDNICTLGEPTTCASAMLDGFISPYPATVAAKLGIAGALIAGKTNLDEFGMGSHSTKSSHGPVKNHFGTDEEPLSAGGSSGGSAVAVATGQCHAALGTDTGGSVRLPAAYTDIVGYKPSYGMVSRWGVVAYANSLDTVGILAPNSRVALDVYEVIRGHDSRDPTCLSVATRSKIVRELQRSKNKMEWQTRIGVPKEYNIEELDPMFRQAWLDTLERLQECGYSIQPVSLPATKSALAAYYVIAPAEASSNLAKYDGVRYGNKILDRETTNNILFADTRGAGLGEEVKKRILLGSYSLSAAAIDNYFIKAQKVRRLVQQDFNRVFAFRHPLLDTDDAPLEEKGVGVIITPTAISLPPTLSTLATRGIVDTFSDDVLTVPASLAGLPAMSVPIPTVTKKAISHNAPGGIGLQIIAQYGNDDLVFKVAQAIENL